jgi:hypothetical protein
MERKYIAVLVTALAGIGCIFYFMAVVYNGDNYRQLNGAVIMVTEMFVLLLLDLMMVADTKRKDIGQGILIGAGITLVVGFGICTSV